MVLVQESSFHCVIFGGRIVESKKWVALVLKKSIEKIPTTRRKNRSSPRYMMNKKLKELSYDIYLDYMRDYLEITT